MTVDLVFLYPCPPHALDLPELSCAPILFSERVPPICCLAARFTCKDAPPTCCIAARFTCKDAPPTCCIAARFTCKDAPPTCCITCLVIVKPIHFHYIGLTSCSAHQILEI
ncbi:hypothetical protein EGW08_023133 [Elysia chlorotica]|uniref:Uncharacterized protein n=1 Tax=Elysia chlorotica TaxID=188477 RepID=A0A433SJF1_ELYCH|nr:hypothetical protein EGW08_023133 [Elysia chlorotica]